MEIQHRRTRFLPMNFRLCHFIMAFISVSYIFFAIYDWLGWIFYPILPYMSEKTMNILTGWALAGSCILNAVLFSVRYYVRRDCQTAFLCSLVVLLSFVSIQPIEHFFYSEQESRPILIIDFIAYFHFVPFFLFYFSIILSKHNLSFYFYHYIKS